MASPVWCGVVIRRSIAAHASAEVLANWGLKEIALWSCHVGADADFIALLEELTGASVLCSQGSIGASAGQVQRVVQQRSGTPLSECTGVSITEMFDGWPPLFKLGRSLKRGKRNKRSAIPFSEGDTFFGVDDENDVWQVIHV